MARIVKNQPANAGDTDSIPGLGRYPKEGNGNPLQCSCLGNPMDRGAWRATVPEVVQESLIQTRVTKQQKPLIYICPCCCCCCCSVASVMSDSVRPHRRQLSRLLRPWDSPGRNTGVGCHFLLQCMRAC